MDINDIYKVSPGDTMILHNLDKCRIGGSCVTYPYKVQIKSFSVDESKIVLEGNDRVWEINLGLISKLQYIPLRSDICTHRVIGRIKRSKYNWAKKMDKMIGTFHSFKLDAANYLNEYEYVYSDGHFDIIEVPKGISIRLDDNVCYSSFRQFYNVLGGSTFKYNLPFYNINNKGRATGGSFDMVYKSTPESFFFAKYLAPSNNEQLQEREELTIDREYYKEPLISFNKSPRVVASKCVTKWDHMLKIKFK